MLDTLRCASLLRAVKDARVVTLGDTEQLQAIGASGWYAAATARHKPNELTVVRRQKDPLDRDAAQLIRDGRAPEALKQYAERGRFHVAETPQHAMAQMFRDYTRFRDMGLGARDVKILADQSNEMIDTANRFVQQDRLKRGEISEHGIEVRDRQADRRWVLHDNDEILFLNSVKVKGSDAIKNGSVGKIMRVDQRYNTVRIRFHETGREVTIPATADIGLSTAMHAQKFQGGEMQVALVVGGRSNTTKNAGYVLASRGISETHVYANEADHGQDPIQGLGQLWQQQNPQELASEAIERARAEEPLEIPVPREIAPRGDHLRPDRDQPDRERLPEPEWAAGQRVRREPEPNEWELPEQSLDPPSLEQPSLEQSLDRGDGGLER
jgi:ATP-dependent exoDNAse (exonuclease V) alpha subunit